MYGSKYAITDTKDSSLDVLTPMIGVRVQSVPSIARALPTTIARGRTTTGNITATNTPHVKARDTVPHMPRQALERITLEKEMADSRTGVESAKHSQCAADGAVDVGRSDVDLFRVVHVGDEVVHERCVLEVERAASSQQRCRS